MAEYNAKKAEVAADPNAFVPVTVFKFVRTYSWKNDIEINKILIFLMSIINFCLKPLFLI
jgi:hypothetical protein